MRLKYHLVVDGRTNTQPLADGFSSPPMSNRNPLVDLLEPEEGMVTPQISEGAFAEVPF